MKNTPLIPALAILATLCVSPLSIAQNTSSPSTEDAFDEEFTGGQETVQERSLDALKSLSDIENLRIDLFSDGAVVQGELLSPEDLRRVEKVAQSLEGVVNLCTLHPEALETAARFLNTRIRELDIHGLELSVAGGWLILTGSASSEGQKITIQKLCDAYGLPLFDMVNGEQRDTRMVLLEVNFTEVSRDSFREIGVSWPSALPLSDPSGIRLDRLSPSQPLEVALDFLIQKGRARVLSRPRILCRSGESASFQAGGEIAIPKSDAEGRVSVTWKRYGIILEASPVVDGKGQIHARLMSEVSTVDRSNAVDGIPGILTRRIETHLSLAPGQAAVLSGLVNSEDGETITRIPVLGDLPILGELFKSRSFQKRETELVVFLTPNLVGSSTLRDAARPETGDQRFGEQHDRHLQEKEEIDGSDGN